MPSRRRLLAAVVVSALLLGGAPALAQSPYDGDPLGLIAYIDEVSRRYTSGTDVFEVWVCDTPSGNVGVDLGATVNLLNSQVTPYYQWLSEGRYVPTFVSGGVVVVTTDTIYDCEIAAANSSLGTSAGGLVVTDTDWTGGYGTIGAICAGCPRTFPGNGRIAVVGGATVSPVYSFGARLMAVAHEFGHTIGWPHSFTGQTFDGPLVWEYDNPMDIMSGQDMVGLEAGTLVINRYAAGWVDPTKVRFHRQGNFTYILGIPGTGADQMLVLPIDGGPGYYDFLGVRIRSGYDFNLPAEGVEVYTIDQRPSACTELVGGLCVGADRRTQQNPPVAGYGTAHVLAVGQTAGVRGVTITVLSAAAGVYTVQVSGAAVAERFVDEDGNPHEANIEKIALAGITLGCNPPINDRYCPISPVTRGEMATFLVRAVGAQPSTTYHGYFPDVPAGAWFTPFVERLYELGVTAGYTDGTFRPNTSVSRAEMAVFLVRALQQNQGVPPPSGIFSDVPTTAWYASFAERLYALGVTAGCATNPLRYCPSDAVLRDQMGSFLARAFVP